MAKKWKPNGTIKSKLLPIEIAANDYWEASDSKESPMVIGGKKQYFTWDEAMAIKAEGWRLPTRAEWAVLCAEFGEKDGDIDHDVLTKALGLSDNGYVVSSLRGGGDYGYYWSSTADPLLDSAYVLYFYSCFVCSSTGVPYDCGLSVRLVRDVKE